MFLPQPTTRNVDVYKRQVVEQSLLTDTPVYGMVIHEASDLNPASRVEYLGKNADYTPLKVDLTRHCVDYGAWRDWPWLKANTPVMCDWDGHIDYYLDPTDYTKKAGSNEPSDVANLEYEGNAMAVAKLIYTCTYRIGHDRYVYFCDQQISCLLYTSLYIIPSVSLPYRQWLPGQRSQSAYDTFLLLSPSVLRYTMPEPL